MGYPIAAGSEQAPAGGKTLALVMIVRDGMGDLPRTLAAAKRYISSWTICDTGSTDGTPELIERLLDGIPGQLYRYPWVNFGQNRSQAFALAKGTAEWLLCLDADMTVEIDPDFEPDPAYDCYMIEMADGGWSWRLPLLLRGDLAWRSIGSVHEYTALYNRAYRSANTDAVRVHFPPTTSSPTKRHWQAGMLEEELAQDPTNARSTFYLAQTYMQMGDPRAIELFRKRVTMPGSIEETWFAKYRAALLEPDWSTRLTGLLAAWEARPSRLEPLHAVIRELNSRGLHESAYRLAQVAVVPTEDILFVDTGIWRWGIAFERSIAAWWVGEVTEAQELMDRLLAMPDLPAGIREATERNRALPVPAR